MVGHDGLVTVFLGGDVMTGRGVDQILAHPGDPQLWEEWVHSAADYVRMAEDVNGPIPAPVEDRWLWGDALELLDEHDPDVRLVNLETSITSRGEPSPGKAVHYRMAPQNGGCLGIARLDAVALANNHVQDFGPTGLVDTLDALAAIGIRGTGGGRQLDEAAQPVVVGTPGRRVVIASIGTPSSGIPAAWAATAQAPGVHLITELSPESARRVLDRLSSSVESGDVVVVSVHWGSNWGFDVPGAHIEFAHQLIDGGVSIVHGHSSHHVRPVEVYRGRLILYGCGGLIDDYEGIPGYEEYRDDLRLLYLAVIEPGTGRLARLRMAPLQARKMRLHRATASDTEFLCRMLNKISPGQSVVVAHDGLLDLNVDSVSA